MHDPIAPNDVVARLRGFAEECAQGYAIEKASLDSIARILGRLYDPQAQGRVLPDPNDDGTSWAEKELARAVAQVTASGAEWQQMR